ncbi:hypothetical protein BGX20_001061 [Mortierella sp. AD010]|nr:hypothetical protein BGX20_001061 [Mortierella sp. AD010]
MVFDTGSSDMWVPSQTCNTTVCMSLLRYNSSASSTYRIENKSFEIKYGDGSQVSGLTALDRVLLSGVSVANQSFGMASVDDSTIAKKGIDGVVGLGFGRAANIKGYTTIVESMLARKIILQPIVSIWLGRQRVGGSNEGSGGAIIFGGVDTTKYVGNFSWAPITDKNSWTVRFDAVSIAGKDLGLSGNALIDSGTSLIVVPTKAASTLHQHIPGAIEDPQVGWILPCNTSAGDLNFTIASQQFRVPAEELVVLYRIPGYVDYCKSAVDVATSDSQTEWILGASFLKNLYTVYDYEALSIGFAQPSNIYNSLANVTLLPNLSSSPSGQGNGTNGTQGGDGGSAGGANGSYNQNGSAQFLLGDIKTTNCTPINMATSHITPVAGVRPEQAPLGSPVPNVPHAISVSLPTFRDNVDYEEAAPRVVNAMVSGYPRFFVSLKVKELGAICEKKYGKPTENSFLWPSRRVAERCRHFVERYYVPTISTDDSTPTPHPPSTGAGSVRIVEFAIHAPISEVKPDGIKQVKVFATFFPKEAYSVAKQFWQHAGDIVSSRQAAFCLRWLALKAEEDSQQQKQKDEATIRMPRGNRHYAAAKPVAQQQQQQQGLPAVQSQDDEDRPVEEIDGMDSRDYEVYVEERYGRNLDLSFAPKAKVALRRRIAAQVAHHAGSASGWTGDKEYVTEDDVYLFPTGMSAIYNAHRIAMTLFPTRKSVCFGFPYTDSLKVLQKFGPGCYFYGHGEEHDIDALEKEVLEKTLGENVKEEDKILAVFCEFPSNPLLKSSNLVRLGQLADKYGFMIIVDETLGNFVNVRILEFADIVVSSLSKIFSGDSNVMGGSLVLNPQRRFYKGLKEAMGREYEDLMWVEDAIFMERNSRTFQARIARIDENTEALCDYLRTHPKVKEVYYPKYVTTANYLTHKVEGAGFGGLFSVIFHSAKGSEQFFDALPFYKGPSLGTNFTLACPYTILAHYYELDWAAQFGIDRNLIRVAVGLEDKEVLFQGFNEALDAITDDE